MTVYEIRNIGDLSGTYDQTRAQSIAAYQRVKFDFTVPVAANVSCHFNCSRDDIGLYIRVRRVGRHFGECKA